MKRRTTKDKISMALESTKDGMTENEIFRYIENNLDKNAKFSTIYTVLRRMCRNSLISKNGDKYYSENRRRSLVDG